MSLSFIAAVIRAYEDGDKAALLTLRDMRGCSLYILKKSDYPADKQAHGCDVDYSRGVAVCI